MDVQDQCGWGLVCGSRTVSEVVGRPMLNSSFSVC